MAPGRVEEAVGCLHHGTEEGRGSSRLSASRHQGGWRKQWDVCIMALGRAEEPVGHLDVIGRAEEPQVQQAASKMTGGG